MIILLLFYFFFIILWGLPEDGHFLLKFSKENRLVQPIIFRQLGLPLNPPL